MGEFPHKFQLARGLWHYTDWIRKSYGVQEL